MPRSLGLLRMAGLLGTLLLISACSATSHHQAASQHVTHTSSHTTTYTEGDQYVTLAAPYQRVSKTGKVEVVEVFSYGCIHCANFAPYAEKLRQSLPAGVVFKLVPASFNAAWLPYAQAYYAATQLGVAKPNHLKLFKQKFKQHYPINSLSDLADFYAREGVSRDKFLKIANSKQASAAIKANQKLIRAWGVPGTPCIVVDGKYRSNNISSDKALVALTRYLVQRELSAKAAK